MFEVHIIELKKQIKDEHPINDWIRLFNAREDSDFDMIKKHTLGIDEAMRVIRQMSLSRRIKWEFEQRQKDWRDRHAQDEYVRDQGRAEGRQEGRQEQALLMYQRCLDKGMTKEEAIELSGLEQKREPNV